MFASFYLKRKLVNTSDNTTYDYLSSKSKILHLGMVQKRCGLLGNSVLSFITFICYIASSAASFMMAPLIEFLLALFLFFAYSSKLNEKFKGIYWPLTDFLRCVTAAIIYFAISIAAVSKYSDGASKAAGVFGFIATIVFAVDFYITFNDLVMFLKQGGSENETEAQKSEDSCTVFTV
ncbi:CKLF-like MARVEL transmembrane domain-containing protein 3 isoform X2 [Chelonia mydas]|uniref:CKLF-like MARVEL transmembrane domain-containing protein 3 isoform X2 n=1 Tax=Chelonia mydas TaxID=8469 RepID=UPI001CA88EC7|nr:CKLF-like MARVEL transmembrane domain-containing protein 3 isoform X2 [Chelonia mydas]